MPRCYMVKKGPRHEAPPPRSPTEATVAPPCYSPGEHYALTENRGGEYVELGGAASRTAEDQEAALELLSLAQSLPPAPAVLAVLPPPPPPYYTYTLQPTNIYILSNEPEPPLQYIALEPPTPLRPPTPPPTSIPTSVIQHASKEKARYDCKECGKRYATSSNLSRHKQTHRSLDSVAAKRCGECGKAYVSMSALAMHVLTHSKGHVCGVCGKTFSRPWLLRGHLRSHTGEKPYSCVSCGKAFADRSNLRAHMQTHTQDKRHECSRCHKSFALKSYLTKHQEAACSPQD